MDIPFVGPAYTDRSPNLNAQTCVNLYVVPGGPTGKRPVALYGTPGLKAHTTIGTTAVRGMHVGFGAYMYAVSGTTVYQVDTAGVASPIGNLNTSSGRVSMANNGQVLCIVDGTDGWLWDGATFAQITDADFPSATQVVFLGGYFLFDDPSTPGKFMVSALYATAIAAFNDPLDYATAEANPDALQRMMVLGDALWLLGDLTAEPWYQSGDVFPFSPIGGGRVDRGCVAKWSAAKAGDALLWLATDLQGRKQVVMGGGPEVQPVTTPAVEFAINSYTTIADATGFAYHHDGHTFYQLNFPSEGATWVYDLSTAMWHRRGGWSGSDWTVHKADTYAYFGGKHLVGDRGTGAVYELDPDTYTDAGSVIRRERTAPAVWADHKRVFHHALTLDVETGVGDVTTPAPTLMLDWSDDGGHTWSGDTFGTMDGGVGATGEYGRRLVFRRLGASRQRYYRVVVTDPVKVAILGADLSATIGAS